MAPEQTRGKPRPASDQYALGIVAYEWLCGTRPFNGSYQEIAVQQVLNPPQALHEHEPTISPALETVILKALAKDPLQRFACVQDFADAFEQACHGTQATIESFQPVLSAVSHSSQPATITPHQESSFSTDRSPSSMVYAVVWSPDRRHIASGGHDRMVHVWDATTGVTSFIYRGHAAGVTAIAWSPDGKFIASGSLHEVQVWNATNGSKASSYRGHEGWVRAIAWSPDGKRIASTSEDKAVQIWEVAKGKQIATYRGHTDWVGNVMWSPDGNRIVSASKDNSIQVWSAEHAP